MPRPRPPWLALLALLCASPPAARGDDRGEITVIGPLPPTVKAAPEPADERPARVQHPLVLSAQLGFNTLAGLGLEGSWMATPHLALEAGLGLGLTGYKLGARARWNFTEDHWTPFAAAGLIHSFGVPTAVKFDDAKSPFTFRWGSASWVQLAAGVDSQYLGDRWVVRFEAGWVVPIQDGGLEIDEGTPTDDARRALWLLGRGKLVLGASVGFAF